MLYVFLNIVWSRCFFLVMCSYVLSVNSGMLSSRWFVWLNVILIVSISVKSVV